MRRLTWIALLACFSLAEGMAGIRPRDSSADYPAHETAGGITVAAVVVSPEEVRKIFATDLNRGGYIVAEVAVYPENGRTVDLSSADFLLRIDSETVRSVGGSAIASILAKREHNPMRPDDVTVVTTASIGRASVNDPATGRRGSATYSDTSVGVGVGWSGGTADRAAIDRDRAAIEQELQEKSLPEGKATSPVAGYLFFPRPRGKAKNATLELTYSGGGGHLTLRLKTPANP
jgi:hypothetical protein